MNDDQELLRAFAENKSQEAFATLVQRHLPVIYAAAFRQTGDAQRAEEIALTAFTLLARKAGSLRHHPALGGWLYTTTGHLAARWRRGEGRRRRRELEAQAMKEAEATPDEIPSETMRPIVDDLILDLPEGDRVAVLLRYFEGRSYAEIGRQLDLTENAARMRVDRALERLRTTLQRRGIVSTAAALGAALTASATLTPPLGLAAGIATSASTAAVGGGLFFLMNTSLLKTGLAVAAIGVCAGGWIWQHHENARLQDQVAALQARLKPASGAKRGSAPSPDAAPSPADFAHLSAQVAALSGSPAATWQERADVLRELVDQFPEAQIPELALATPEDWLDATKVPLITDADYRRAMAQVRTAVVVRFCKQLMNEALPAYLKQNCGTFPTDPAQLEAYFTNPVGPEVWAHYKIVPASRVPNLHMGGETIMTLKSANDPDYDTQIALGPRGMGTTEYSTSIIQPIIDAFRAANPGKVPSSPADLLPYTKTNSQRSAIQAATAKK
jgi:RNA polymerase sigma factor (sigma-70 family)